MRSLRPLTGIIFHTVCHWGWLLMAQNRKMLLTRCHSFEQRKMTNGRNVHMLILFRSEDQLCDRVYERSDWNARVHSFVKSALCNNGWAPETREGEELSEGGRLFWHPSKASINLDESPTDSKTWGEAPRHRRRGGGGLCIVNRDSS